MFRVCSVINSNRNWILSRNKSFMLLISQITECAHVKVNVYDHKNVDKFQSLLLFFSLFSIDKGRKKWKKRNYCSLMFFIVCFSTRKNQQILYKCSLYQAISILKMLVFTLNLFSIWTSKECTKCFWIIFFFSYFKLK